MGLIWLRVLVNPEQMSMLYVIWEASVLIGQLLALQEDNAAGWMTKESPINFRQGKSFSHLQMIQATSKASPACYSVRSESTVVRSGSKPFISV
jgi:hypothetical protein